MRLRWVFTVKTAVIRLKNIFEFVFKSAPSTLYRGRWQKFLGTFDTFTVCSTWHSGNDTARRVEGAEFDYGQNLFLFYIKLKERYGKP